MYWTTVQLDFIDRLSNRFDAKSGISARLSLWGREIALLRAAKAVDHVAIEGFMRGDKIRSLPSAMRANLRPISALAMQ